MIWSVYVSLATCWCQNEMLELFGCIVYCSRRNQKKGRRDNVNRVEVAKRESMVRYKILPEDVILNSIIQDILRLSDLSEFYWWV